MAKNKKPSRLYVIRDRVSDNISGFSERIRVINPKGRIKIITRHAGDLIERKPFTVFFSLIGLILLLIIMGSFLRRPKAETAVKIPIKRVEIYRIGRAPQVHVDAQVEKSGVVKIVALTPGVISGINVTEGQEVSSGTNLVSIATNYSGGNTASLQRQLASTQYKNAKDTYGTQKDIIQKQRDIANQNKTNSDRMRDITNQSISDTQGLIDFDNVTLGLLNQQLQSDPNNIALRSQVSGLEQAINQLNAGQRQARLATDTSGPAAQLVTLGFDLTNRQLDLQQKALDLSLEASRLSLAIAQVNEATMFPSAPFAGVVERVYVTVGQSVNPGTPLLLLHGEQDLKIVAKVPYYIAKNASNIEDSTIYLPDGQTQQITPSYISNEATDGSLYAIFYTLSGEFQNELTDKGYIKIDIPVGYADTSSVAPFIPIDSVYQSQNSSYIFVDDGGTAKSKQVKLGSVFGDYIEVQSGLSSGDNVIVSRNVISGDPVSSR